MRNWKTIFLASLLFFLCPALPAQSERSDPASNPAFMQPKPRHCSPEAATLRMALERDLPLTDLNEKYLLSHYRGQHYVPALIKVSGDFDPGSFSMHEVQVNTAVGDLYSVHIPIDRYRAFLGIRGIEYIELAKKVYPKLDKALEATNVHLVHRGEDLARAYSGKDVVIGIIDFGFDYTHPTFFNQETGAYRIKKVWEQNTLFGDPPPGFSYGRELSEEQALLEAGTDIALTGHGMHVAGIAAGSGGALKDLYRGVAYDSDIVLVSLNAREGVSGNNTGVIDGINYIFQYAESVGKPAVINISQGHHTGPHDGTSLPDQAIDALSGPGRIIVGAVGNEGDPTGFYLHFDHTFDDEPDMLTYLVWPDEISAGITLVDIWGEAGADFQVSLEVFNPKTKVREARSTPLFSEDPVSFVSGTLVDLEGDTLYYEGAIEISPLNNRPHAQLYIDNTGQSKGDDVNLNDLLDNDFVQLKFQADAGTVHAYAANNSGEAFFTDLSGIGADEFIEDVRVIGGNPNSTMGELGGTAHSIISVGGYTTKNAFLNTNGDELGIDDVIGDHYLRTSRGPTLDGRVKPDISAPANLIVTAENSFYTDFDPVLEVDKIEDGGGNQWGFSISRGTSAAAPLVAGIAALMLEAAPDLTPEAAKELLLTHAEQDGFTGTLPNQVWGYGKVNAYRVIASMEQTTSTGFGPVAAPITVFPNPNNGDFMLDAEIRGPVQVRILDYAGRTVFEGDYLKADRFLSLQLPEYLVDGIYFLWLKHEQRTFQSRLVVLD